MMVSFCAVLFPRGVLDEILNLIESVSEGFPSYSRKKGFTVLYTEESKFLYFCILCFHLFYFKLISRAYKHTFVSVNHIISDTGCFKQTGKRILQLP